MASLDVAKIDVIFLEYLQEWLKSHSDLWLSIEDDFIAVWKRDNQTMVSDQVELFNNANELLEWIKNHA